MSYNIIQYGNMIADKWRVDPYIRAIKKSINESSVVLDLGTGSGYFALLSSKFGAKKVYAIDINPLVNIAPKIAKENNLDKKIIFINKPSDEVELPEKVDIIIHDLRGKLPLFKNNLSVLIDARDRFLKRNGTLIAEKDEIWASIIESEKIYKSIVSPWENNNKIKQEAAKVISLNNHHQFDIKQKHLISNPKIWQRINYKKFKKLNFQNKLTFTPKRNGIAHGIVLWFDSTLAGNIKLLNSPNVKGAKIYGKSFLPFLQPMKLSKNNIIEVDISAILSSNEYIWNWNTKLFSKNKKKIISNFKQSTFYGTQISGKLLAKRIPNFKPSLSNKGKIDLEILNMFSSEMDLIQIADKTLNNFPQNFNDIDEALSYVGKLSEKYSE